MLLHGAFLPPRAAIEEVLAVVRSVAPPVEEEAPVPKGLFGRRHKHRSEGPAVLPDPLDLLVADSMSLPITGFGNLTTNDAYAIAAAISAAAGSWEAPTVRLAGGAALDFPGDWNVWAKVTGETDALATIARGVVHEVEPLGFFVDRRKFRPMLAVAKVTAATTGPYLEEIVAALDAFEGQEWVVQDVVITALSTATGGPAFTEFRRIPLAP
jgi:2'-5' RNA ligase